jgi:hypothetical protein
VTGRSTHMYDREKRRRVRAEAKQLAREARLERRKARRARGARVGTACQRPR